jgi:hypothetical protein
MRVLVIGGMHGNEQLGILLVAQFRQKPVDGVDVVLANEPAIVLNQRFITEDLNRSFPGQSGDRIYEPRRAAELLTIAGRYDVVLDFHNTHCPDNDCGFVGRSASHLLDQVSVFFGLNRIIVADYECINKYAGNCLSVEISLDSERNNVEFWYQRITALAALEGLDIDDSNIEKYRFVYRMTLKDRDRLELPTKHLKAFTPLGSGLAGALGIPGPVYPIFIADKFTPYNYGGILRKISV